jgi:hypothetical protein
MLGQVILRGPLRGHLRVTKSMFATRVSLVIECGFQSQIGIFMMSS